MPNDKISKFHGTIPKKLPEEEAPAPPQAAALQAASKTGGRRGGKIAKYKSDNYKLTNFYMHVDTYADAQARLRKDRKGKDMSDLLNELLAEWLKSQSV